MPFISCHCSQGLSVMYRMYSWLVSVIAVVIQQHCTGKTIYCSLKISITCRQFKQVTCSLHLSKRYISKKYSREPTSASSVSQKQTQRNGPHEHLPINHYLHNFFFFQDMATLHDQFSLCETNRAKWLTSFYTGSYIKHRSFIAFVKIVKTTWYADVAPHKTSITLFMCLSV